MKLNVLLSILFAVVTSFTAIHEVKHIQHNDGSTCLVCTVSHNLVSADTVKLVSNIEIPHFENITQNNQITYPHARTNSNQTRAPPLAS